MGAPPARRDLFQHQGNDASRVRVVTRIRPLSSREQQRGAKPVLTCLSSAAAASSSSLSSAALPQHRPPSLIQVTTTAGSPEHTAPQKRWFDYDAVWEGASTTQAAVYEQSGAQSLVTHDLFQGYNATILAYGQTGSGKTYTMGGTTTVTTTAAAALSDGDTQDTTTTSSSSSGTNTNEDTAGIIPRACADLFRQIDAQCDGNAKVTLSYTELYNEQIRDLLWTAEPDDCVHNNTLHNSQPSNRHNQASASQSASSPPPLKIRETLDGQVYVAGVTERTVTCPADVECLLQQASARRVTAATAMNAVSSRSHAICTLRIEGVLQRNREDDDNDDECTENNRGMELDPEVRPKPSVETKFSSKLTLVDLAGSERIKKTKAVGARQTEGININKSLLVLGQVVSALSEQKKPPYRDSKLTRLLQDSLGGNSRTLLVACVSPADYNLDESLNTLRYAARARRIQNAATRNLVQTTLSPQEAAALQRDNAALRQQVAELQQTIRRLTASNVAPSTDPRAASLSPTHTISTTMSSSDEDEDEEEEKEAEDCHALDHPCTSNGSSKEQVFPNNQLLGLTERATEAVTECPPPIETDLAEYLIQISNLKVEVAQLKGDAMENEMLAKRHAELQVRFAEVQAEADSARIAATYMSDIVDELRGLKHDDLARKQWVLQLKLKEQNTFSLVQAMLETYRMQLGKLSLDFEKAFVRPAQQQLLARSEHAPRLSTGRPPAVVADDFLGANADYNDDDQSMEFLAARPGFSSPTDIQSVELGASSTDGGSSFSAARQLLHRRPSWWGGKLPRGPPESSSSHHAVSYPPLPWTEATASFHSQIRVIEANIGNDAASLLSSMKRLAEEAEVLETEIGLEETSSQHLLSSTEETKSELVDHLSSLLLVKEAAAVVEATTSTS